MSALEKKAEDLRLKKEDEELDERQPLLGGPVGIGIGANMKNISTASLPPLILYFIGVFALMYLEDWPFLTSNYVVTQIITTIGYGDFTVSFTGAKVFMAFYAMSVIVVLAYYHSLLIGSLVSWECDVLRKYLRNYEIDNNEIRTEEEAMRKYGLANQAIASLAAFLPFLAFGTLYYRWQ